MNLFKISMAVAILLALSLIGCADADQDAVRSKAREAIPASTAPAEAPAQTASINSNVPHYKCNNNCIGSGGDAQGNCPVCGEAYVHNQEYHNNPTNAPAPANVGTTQTITPPPGVGAEPAQNADGVWHYTCAKGCAGGAGAAGTCAGCGGELAHNQGYH